MPHCIASLGTPSVRGLTHSLHHNTPKQVGANAQKVSKEEKKLAIAREQVAKLRAYDADGDVAKWRCAKGAHESSDGEKKLVEKEEEDALFSTAPSDGMWATRSADVSKTVPPSFFHIYACKRNLALTGVAASLSLSLSKPCLSRSLAPPLHLRRKPLCSPRYMISIPCIAGCPPPTYRYYTFCNSTSL